MTYEQAQDAIKFYLHYDGADPATKARLDGAIPNALNNARLWAERKHDWAYSYRELWYRVGAETGCSLFEGQLTRAALDEDPLPTASKLKSVAAAYLENSDASLSPLMVRPLGAVQRLKIQKRDLDVEDPFWPESTDEEYPTTPYLTVNGLNAALLPKTTAVVRLDGYMWMPAYTEQDQEDFFLTYVPDVLIWKATIDCNYIAQVFVNRQEGNVGVPTSMLQDAWESAMEWDNFQHQKGINYQLG
jgi:hypothetical protein